MDPEIYDSVLCVSLTDILSSESFASTEFSHEQQDQVKAADDGSGKQRAKNKGQSQREQNSANVALLVAKAFVQFQDISTVLGEGQGIDLSTLQIDDFFVELKYSPKRKKSWSQTKGQFCQDICFASASEVSQLAEKSEYFCKKLSANRTDGDNQQPLFSGPVFFFSDGGKEDTYCDLTHQNSSKEGASKIIEDENGLEVNLGYTSECFASEKSVSKKIPSPQNKVVHGEHQKVCQHPIEHKKCASNENYIPDHHRKKHITHEQNFIQRSCEREKSQKSLETFHANFDSDKFQTINATSRGHGYWTLLRAEILFPTRVPIVDRFKSRIDSYKNHQRETKKLQLLGYLLFNIFSKNCFHLLPKALEGNPNIFEYENKDIARHTKCQRNQEKSLFSHLIDTCEHSVSICRLLSDLIDVGDYGLAASPFQSLNEVVTDLEQITSNPGIFLNDRKINQQHASNLTFGQRHYGRKREIKMLLKISMRVASSSNSRSRSSEGKESNGQFVKKNAEVIFVSGIAGCGKTYLGQEIGGILSRKGWIVLKAKLKRGQEYKSRQIFSSMFDGFVTNLIDMASGRTEADVSYRQQAIKAIVEALGNEGLYSLSDFIPSLQALIHDDSGRKKQRKEDATSNLLTAHLLSKFFNALLGLDRFIMICLDDMQWSDLTVLSLINELITSTGGRNFLFFGTYRDDEITSSHPLSSQLTCLEKNSSVNVTEINLAGLLKVDVIDMITSELILPQRLVTELANIVYKKTSGHALFVVELLNLLLRNSIIQYNPLTYRFVWDSNSLCSLSAYDNVANLIVSKLSFLEPNIRQCLKILSCFGVQSDYSLLRFLEGLPKVSYSYITSSIPVLVDNGILEVSGSLVLFSHDLIQKHVYENIPINERQRLHLDIGNFLGINSSPESTLAIKFVTTNMQHKSLSDAMGHINSTIFFSMVTFAADQINLTDADFVVNQLQRIQFAEWNLKAGDECVDKSNFQAALFYFKKGINWLQDVSWRTDAYILYLRLHEGAALAYLAIGEENKAGQIANEAIANIRFEDTLVLHYLVIKSLESSGKFEESTSKGLEVLKQLNFDFPLLPHPANIMSAINETSNMVSQYDIKKMIISGQNKVGDSTKKVLKIMDALALSCYCIGSHYFSLVSCEIIKYSLKNSICKESATAFACFGYFKIYLEDKYLEGRHWGDVAASISKKKGISSSTATAELISYSFISIWFLHPRETSSKLFDTFSTAMTVGDFSNAAIALSRSWHHSLLSGEKLLLLKRYVDKRFKLLGKYNKEFAKFVVPDLMILDQLTSNNGNRFAIFEGLICNEDSLLADAKLRNNVQMMELIYFRRFYSSFWSGNFVDAEKWSKKALSCPTSGRPKLLLIHHTFLRGLVAFYLYRHERKNDRLNDGVESLKKIEKWAQNSTANFTNKLLLLRAEHFNCKLEIDNAISAYEGSIKFANDHGFVHEQGIACEMKGRLFSSIGKDLEASGCFYQAYLCYKQWGAAAVAEKLYQDEHLHLHATANGKSQHGILGNKREWSQK